MIGWLKRTVHGQSTIEMAIILPVLLFLIIGTLDMGRAIYAHLTIANAAREGARKALVSSTSETAIINAAIQAGVGLKLNTSNVTMVGSRNSAGEVVTIIVTYNFVPVTPMISHFTGPSLQLRAFSTVAVD